ncbi:hypothetical protein CGCTS75_v012464 [Colletotrichum tropicale]|nr:hypothetical protein CGCTS75_v012464 [Colletotrichum tropicale]
MLPTNLKTTLLAVMAVGLVNAQNPGDPCSKANTWACSGPNSLGCKVGSEGKLIWNLEGNCSADHICYFNSVGNFDCKKP